MGWWRTKGRRAAELSGRDTRYVSWSPPARAAAVDALLVAWPAVGRILDALRVAEDRDDAARRSGLIQCCQGWRWWRRVEEHRDRAGGPLVSGRAVRGPWRWKSSVGRR